MLRISLASLRIALCLLLLGPVLPDAVAVAAQPPDFSKLGIERLLTRLEDAYDDGDQVSYVAAVTTLARNFPSKLESLEPYMIHRAFDKEWKWPAPVDALIGAYESLFAANWKTDGIEPPSLQGGYIRLMIDQQQWSKAGEVVRRLHTPRIALELKSDRRSDPLVHAHPERFDIEALKELQIKELEAAVQRFPRRLSAWNSLFYAYLESGQYRQILAVADQLLAAAARGGSASEVFEDPEDLSWVHDLSACAWMGLGDWAAAEREFRLAANLFDRDNISIGSTINLAGFLAAKGDEKSALEVLAQLSKHQNRISAYGRMSEMSARHIAALSSQNHAASTKALEYLRKNRDAAPDLLLEALVRERKFDEATAELDRRLADPDLRWRALAFVQEYTTVSHMLPHQQTYLRSREEWLSREDVRTSVNKVGRIGPAPIASR